MIVKEMQVRQAKVYFVDNYIQEHNVTREQSIEVLNRVADKILLQLNLARAAKKINTKPSE